MGALLPSIGFAMPSPASFHIPALRASGDGLRRNRGAGGDGAAAIEEATRRPDAAPHAAKAWGRNRAVIADPAAHRIRA